MPLTSPRAMFERAYKEGYAIGAFNVNNMEIIQGIMEHEEADDSVVFFTRMGISVKTIMKMEAAYGEAMISMVKENPYRLIEEIDGIGFKTADKLAKELAFAEDRSLPHQGCHIILCAGFMYGKRGYLYNAGTDTETVL